MNEIEHVPQDGSCRVRRASGFRSRPVFFVNRLPIQAARVLFPVRVANGAPHEFKRGQIGLPLLRIQLREEGGRQQDYCKDTERPL